MDQLDVALIGRLADALIYQDYAVLDAYFNSVNGTSPTIRWHPVAADIEEPILQRLLAYWESLKEEDAFPHVDAVDPIEFGFALGHVMLLEPAEDGLDFIYRVYGSEIAGVFGTDLNRKRVSDHTFPSMSQYFLANYWACTRHRAPLFSRHAPPIEVSVAYWDRLVLPLRDDAGEIARLLVGNVSGQVRPFAGPHPTI